MLYLALVPIAAAFLPGLGGSSRYTAPVAASIAICLIVLHIVISARTSASREREDGSDSSDLRRMRGIKAAMDIVTRLGANAGLPKTREAIVHAGRLSLNNELIALFTIDPCSASIDCASTPGVSDDLKRAFLLLYERRITDLSHNAAWADDFSSDDLPDGDARGILIDNDIKSIAAIPIRSDSGACGAIGAFYTDIPDDSGETLMSLEVLAAQAATALSYAASLEQSQALLEGLYGENQALSQQATIDGLTGLPNHRTFRQTLNELCRKSLGKNGRPLSMVMVDVDHFKIYNDTHGHPEGDAVLKSVAKLMSAGLRQLDLAARYGGEEFAILFNGASKEAACVAAERIRRAIADHTFDRGAVTVSMGVAEFPLDTSDPGELIELADKALYHAKSIGRNRVYAWGSANSVASSGSKDSSSVQQTSVLVVESGTESFAADVTAAMQGSCAVTAVNLINDALETLKSQAYDIVLVSKNVLPDGNIRHLSKITAVHSQVPVLLIADNLSMDDSKEAVRRGAADIIARTDDPANLPIAIERNLERQRLELQRLMQRSTGVMLQAIEALVSAVDAKDHHTAGHSHRVTELSMSLSDQLGISNEERYALELASKLHDIGKLALPDSALNKSSALTDDEWKAMREHPVVGAKIVGEISELAYVSTIIRHHHERLDGSGYPDGLSGSAIPYLSRILAVADTYEAMTAERAYRKPLTPTQAIYELRDGAGKLYEPDVVDVLERQLRQQGEIAHRPLESKAA